MVKKVDYDSFGSIISDTNPAMSIPFGFAGGLQDQDIGLIRFGARDYDPALGRWTAKDPIDFAGGDLNLYGYVQNNPANKIDPFGLRDYTILDWPDPIISPFQAHDFKITMRNKFLHEYQENGDNYWKRLSEEYTWIDAIIDMYRFDEKEALEYYKKKKKLVTPCK